MPSTPETSRKPPAAAREAGAWLLWFAVLGGVVAWAGHLAAAWGAVELGCYPRESTVLGLSVRGFAAVATVVPLLVALASLAAALRFRTRQLAPGGTDEVAEPRAGRAEFMAHVGLWLNVLAVLMIAFGGLAVIWFAPCGL